jgi:hypothetical protein
VIARDEAEHAVLAWRFLRYAVDRGGDAVKQRLYEALENVPRPVELPSTQVAEQVWNHYGRLTPAQGARVVERAWLELILPAAESLLGSYSAGMGSHAKNEKLSQMQPGSPPRHSQS